MSDEFVIQADLGLIQSYLLRLTEGRVAAQGEPMEHLDAMEEAIDDMAAAARDNGDEDLLRLVIDALISGPAEQLDPFRGAYWMWSDDELVDLLIHAYRHIWPGHALSEPEDAATLEFLPPA